MLLHLIIDIVQFKSSKKEGTIVGISYKVSYIQILR